MLVQSVVQRPRQYKAVFLVPDPTAWVEMYDMIRGMDIPVRMYWSTSDVHNERIEVGWDGLTLQSYDWFVFDDSDPNSIEYFVLPDSEFDKRFEDGES